MTDNLQVRKQLAAIASFRILHDKKKDPYEVLRCFIRNTIAKYALRVFTAAELLDRLNEEFGFGKLPIFVVEKAVKPLTSSHSKSGYTCDELPKDEPELDKELKQTDKDIEYVLNKLYQYVETSRSCELTEAEKQNISNDLSVFLLTNKADEDSVLISSFVIENTEDKKIQSTLDEMREGMILYSGLSYSTTKDASDKWNSPMTVYLDTELLFHASGLNGELKKKVFDDFKALVDEVNADSLNKRGKKLIQFKCFNYVNKEVDAVFGNAQDIIEGKAKLAPGKTAQELLIKGVHESSELVRKRVAFDEVVKTIGVLNDEESEGFYHTSTYSFNLEDIDLLKKLKDSFADDYRVTDKRLMDSLQSLSYINVRRKTYAPKDFEQAKTILLTENNTTQKISHSPDIKKPGIVPLCTDLYYFTNRLWTKLGKGFGTTATPSIFTAASKARFIISSKIDMMVSDEYDKLCKEYEDGNLTDSQADSFLYKLKIMAKNPEEIKSDDIVDLNLSVNGSRLEMHLQEQFLKDAEHKKTVQKFEEQSKIMSRYEQQEANNLFQKAIGEYKKKRNDAYSSAMYDAWCTVGIVIMLAVIAILLGVYVKINENNIWIALLSSCVPLLPGLIWFLAKTEFVSNSFRYCFTGRLARRALKRMIIQAINKQHLSPSYNAILSGIKERNGSVL